MTACRSCSAPVTWVEMESGARMPLDPDPVPTGTIRLYEKSAVVLKGVQLIEARESGESLYLTHFASCPNASKHRRS